MVKTKISGPASPPRIRRTPGEPNRSFRNVNILFAAGLYMSHFIALNEVMSLGEMVLLIAGGLMLVFAGVRFANHFFSEEAKRERRRRRSNTPISTRSKRPAVRFSVHTKKSRRK